MIESFKKEWSKPSFEEEIAAKYNAIADLIEEENKVIKARLEREKAEFEAKLLSYKGMNDHELLIEIAKNTAKTARYTGKLERGQYGG